MSVEMKKTSLTIQPNQSNKSIFVKSFSTPCGNRIAPIIENKYNDNLKKEVATKTGEFDLYEEIQASSNGTEIEMLKAQARRSGISVENDPDLVSGFNQSLVPTDIHDAMKISSNVQGAFRRLPEELQNELFGGNANDYLNAVLDGSVSQKILDFYEQKATAPLVADIGGDK